MAKSSFRVALGTALSVGLLAAPVTALPANAKAPDTPATTKSAAAANAATATKSAIAESAGVIINEAYTNAGSANAVFKNKFVELYNTTDTALNLTGWSLQYRSATGTAAPNNVAALTGSIPAHGYFLVKGGSNGAVGADLPAADVTSTGLNFKGTDGTIVLADTGAALASLPTGDVGPGAADVTDLLGYGTSNTFETAPVPAPSNNQDPKSINRTGFADTDNNAADFSLSAAVTPTNAAGDTVEGGGGDDGGDPLPAGYKSIADIQGTGDASPITGRSVSTRGKVTGVYPSGGFDGYYLQTPGTGGSIDPATHKASDGIFIYSPGTVDSVKIGDYVEVEGVVAEYYGMTQLTVAAGKLTQLSEAAEEVKAAAVTLPADESGRESLEGMLLAPQGDFTITDNYSLNQYGEIGLAAGKTPLLQPTVVAPPGTDENAAVGAQNTARAVTLDDGATTNFLSDANKSRPLPYLTATAHVRVGSAAGFDTEVIFDYRNDTWKFQPLTQLTPANAPTVQPASFSKTRTAAPEKIGGDLSLATFNVLNYFTTTGDQLAGCSYYTDRNGNPVTVSGGCDARGAANAAMLKRQQDKLVAAINALGADVVSLEEIENSAKFGKDRDDALAKLVAALNAGAPDTWAYVPSPKKLPALADQDVIRTAFIYRKAAAAPVGESTILTGSEAFADAREPLAQAFAPAGAGESGAGESGAGESGAGTFLVIANHFKSKGSDPGSGPNADQGDGQGAWNAARVEQAHALLDFADSVKADAGTSKVFLVGDFNSYLLEDPLTVLADAGYLDQGSKTGKHTYAYGGMVGSLDHIFVSADANAAVSGADIWNINSVESVALEYSRINYNVTNYYVPDMYRASDHDPVLVGLNLAADPAASTDINLLNINDFHGRIDNNTVNFAGTVETLRQAGGADNTLFLSAGDNFGASSFASFISADQPTIDVLNALGLEASAVGNHEFDKGISDLKDRVIDAADPNAQFDYLGANVYKKGTQDPVLDEYAIFTVKGVRIAVIGAVTEQVPSLVTPEGIAGLDFGDPVAAVNRVAKKIEAGDLADVIVAEYHEGASEGTPEGATLEEEVAAGGAFADIVNDTSAEVDAIFTGHTHKQYAWDGPIPGEPGKTRPILQTGSYGANVGQVQLTVDNATDAILSYQAHNVARSTAPAADLVAAYPRVKKVNDIVTAALAKADEVGSQPVGKVTADITTAFKNGERDDRGSESTLGNLVADVLLDTLKTDQYGSAEIGVVNPGGLRAELYYGDDGVITYEEANNVLPFVNNLWTTTLTGAEVKTMLEQQWQPAGESRPFLNLGLSKNVDYTYDPDQPAGERITSVMVNGAPLDPARDYRIGTFSFLAQGGDNFSVFTKGTNVQDTGLIDRDAWIAYLKANQPVSPSFDRRGVEVQGAPAKVTAGDTVNFDVAKLDLTSLGSPANTALAISYVAADGTATSLGSVPVTAGAASVQAKIPAAASGDGQLVLTAAPSGTTVTLAVQVTAGDGGGSVCVPPVPPRAWWDIGGWIRYVIALVAYISCLNKG